MSVILLFLISLPILVIFVLLQRRKLRKNEISFFHPNCAAGGGGEMVMWTIVKVLQEHFPNLKINVFAATDKSKDEILQSVKDTFGFDFAGLNIEFYNISSTYSLVTKKYKFFTLILQAIGTIICAVHSIKLCNSEYFFDTTGYAFSYPIAKLAGGKVMTYTHYPTISTDMLKVVEEGKVAINNNSRIAHNKVLSTIKLIYYKIFAFMYYLVGQCAELVFVNGSWTKGHISYIWKMDPILLFPPCDIKNNNDCHKEGHLIVSIGQFRPEKNHPLQIEAMKILIDKHPELKEQVKFVVIGGVRDDDDRKRKNDVIELVNKYNLQDVICIPESTSYEEKINYLKKAEMGLHCMWNEHFGICVVEYMGFGAIPIAHRSGGPLLDIVDEDNGYLAETAEEYADAIYNVVSQPEKSKEMSKKAIEKAKKFSVEAFEEQCLRYLEDYFKN